MFDTDYILTWQGKEQEAVIILFVAVYQVAAR